MLTRKARYAVKALMFIAKNQKDSQLVPVSLISKEEKIPYKFLEAILADLKAGGIVGSKKGASGGYFLSRAPEKIVLTEIIRISNGPIAMIPCVSLNYYQPCEDCPNEQMCSLHLVLTEVRDATLAIFSRTSIKDLVDIESKPISQKDK